MSEIGAKIKKLRMERKWSQEFLAHKIGVGQQYISKYEAGRMVPSSKTVDKLAEAFEVSTDFLISKEKIDLSSVNLRDKKFRELLNELNDLNEEDLLTVKNVIEALVFRRKFKK
ncbi:helix-turn-helix protein [Hydrogenispora ethanolica]|uniref:Helix-turn-helix protein n=1 Tax=Hydrogenispora ethanolica TaxID=1082276 RepID=A0A4R1RCW0_HYDET|nr:helix-turn-helix transcriptional regulator [Hydrogenispora ethanolica]TCL63322.1 helix-turn-helix protein [Hydrogenispora ethanolica]